MKSERKTILVKAESSPGTDATPSASTDAFQAIDFKWDGPAKAQTDEYKYDAGYYGSSESFIVSLMRECSYAVPIIGAGTPLGTNYPAPLLAIYRMAGHASVVSAGVSVTLNPVSTGEEACTMDVNEDGFRRKMLFSRASLQWVLEEGKVGRALVKQQGLYSTPTDQAFPTPTYPTLQKPVGFNKANTVVTLGALSLKCKKVMVDGGRTWAYRNMANAEDIVPIDCLPTAEVAFELPTVASKPVYTELESATIQALSIAHGTVNGNKFTLAAARANLIDISEERDRGVLFITAKFKLLPTTGGDQYTILLT